MGYVTHKMGVELKKEKEVARFTLPFSLSTSSCFQD